MKRYVQGAHGPRLAFVLGLAILGASCAVGSAPTPAPSNAPAPTPTTEPTPARSLEPLSTFDPRVTPSQVVYVIVDGWDRVANGTLDEATWQAATRLAIEEFGAWLAIVGPEVALDDPVYRDLTFALRDVAETLESAGPERDRAISALRTAGSAIAP